MESTKFKFIVFALIVALVHLATFALLKINFENPYNASENTGKSIQVTFSGGKVAAKQAAVKKNF